MRLDITHILTDMKNVINEHENLYELVPDGLVSDAVQYVLMYPKTLDFPLALTEDECMEQLKSLLNSIQDDQSLGDRFHEFFILACGGLDDPRMRDLLANLLVWSLDERESQLKTLREIGLLPPDNDLCLAKYIKSESSSSLPSTLSRNSNDFGQLMMRCHFDALPPYVEANELQPFNERERAIHRNFKSSYEIVQNAIYALLGMGGKYLKKNLNTGRLALHPRNKSRLKFAQKSMLLRLAEAGFFHDQVQKFSSFTTDYSSLGSMSQAFKSRLKQELSDYRGQVSQLQDILNNYRETQLQLYVDRRQNWIHRRHEPMTLLRLVTWYMKPLFRLQWLTKIASDGQLKKGGELASFLYNYINTGDPYMHDVAKDLLTGCCSPMLRMISNWMLEGNINDSYDEFFVESLPEVGADRLWHDKFRLRLDMLPKFISLDLADKILKTGKSINFLREICKVDDAVKGREHLKDIINNRVSQIFSFVADTKWHAAIETCYTQTSKHVMDIMVGPHKLLVHLQGMRSYLLLGQGDFVSIFIENIKGELDKLGTDIYNIHDLSSMLDAALRCTNAQYDDPEILNHLDVIVRSPYPGDCGWDVISLQYTLQGPLATMLEPAMPTYKTIFKPLWRMKHMEFVLSTKIWKEQMSNAKVGYVFIH
ncbi:hypothetical protein ACLKA7_006521 [Drosophila subpalustris]